MDKFPVGKRIIIEYDDEWFPGEVVKHVRDGIKVRFDIDSAWVNIPTEEFSSRIRPEEPSSSSSNDDNASSTDIEIDPEGNDA